MLVVFLIGLISFQLNAQELSYSVIQRIDTNRLTNFNSDSVRKYFTWSDTLISYMLRKMEEYTLSLNQINAKKETGK